MPKWRKCFKLDFLLIFSKIWLHTLSPCITLLPEMLGFFVVTDNSSSLSVAWRKKIQTGFIFFMCCPTNVSSNLPFFSLYLDIFSPSPSSGPLKVAASIPYLNWAPCYCFSEHHVLFFHSIHHSLIGFLSLCLFTWCQFS